MTAATAWSYSWSVSAADLVHWHCVRPQHRALAGRDGAPFTVHEGEWARRPAAAPIGERDEHDWSRVEGHPLRSLMSTAEPATRTDQPA